MIHGDDQIRLLLHLLRCIHHFGPHGLVPRMLTVYIVRPHPIQQQFANIRRLFPGRILRPSFRREHTVFQLEVVSTGQADQIFDRHSIELEVDIQS